MKKAKTNGHKAEATPVPFVPLVDVVKLVEQLKTNAESHESEIYAHSLEGSYKQGLVDGAIETCKAILELLGAIKPTTGNTEGGDVG